MNRLQGINFASLHRKKKVREFPVPSRDVPTKLSLGGNNDVITELFLPRASLVNDIPAGDGKLVNLFLRCTLPSEQLRQIGLSNRPARLHRLAESILGIDSFAA
jgi:hypothetical protein